jgi:hypothetical protein
VCPCRRVPAQRAGGQQAHLQGPDRARVSACCYIDTSLGGVWCMVCVHTHSVAPVAWLQPFSSFRCHCVALLCCSRGIVQIMQNGTLFVVLAWGQQQIDAVTVVI